MVVNFGASRKPLEISIVVTHHVRLLQRARRVGGPSPLQMVEPKSLRAKVEDSWSEST